MRLKKFARIAVYATLLIGLVVAFFTWRNATRPPDWWNTSLPPSPRASHADLGADVEMAVTTHITQNRPLDNTWTIDITEQQASAWLTGRLPDWLLNRSAQIPANWSSTAVRFAEGEVHIVAEVTGGATGRRYVGVILKPEILSDTGLRLSAVSASLGRVRTSFSTIAARLKPQLEKLSAKTGADTQQAQAIRDFIDSHALTITPAEFELDDGRRIRITGVEVGHGKLTLTCTTLRAAGNDRRPRSSGAPR